MHSTSIGRNISPHHEAAGNLGYLIILTFLIVVSAAILFVLASPAAVSGRQEIQILKRDTRDAGRLGTSTVFVEKDSENKLVFVKDERFDTALIVKSGHLNSEITVNNVKASIRVIPESTRFYLDHTFLKMFLRLIFSSIKGNYIENRNKILDDIKDRNGKFPSKSQRFVRKTEPTIWVKIEAEYETKSFKGRVSIYESADYQTMVLINIICRHDSHVIFLEMNSGDVDEISKPSFKYLDGNVVIHHYPAVIRNFDQSQTDRVIDYIVTDVLERMG